MHLRKESFVALACLAAATTQAVEIVGSNSGGSGDFFTNAGASAANTSVTGFSGPNGEVFEYRQTKNNGLIGINDTFARSGNGSAHIRLDGTAGGKSEIAMSTAFTAAGDSAGALGLFDELTAWSADLLTQSSSIADLAPILRLELYNGASYGSLVFDTSWTPAHFGAFAFGTWQNLDLVANAATTWLRATGSLNTLYGPGAVDSGERTLADWMSVLDGEGFYVISANAGMGTADISYEGAVDNLTLGFSGNSTTYNFEVVPEPASMAALGLGAAALLRRRRK